MKYSNIPRWIKKSVIDPDTANYVGSLIKGYGLHTVCASALCPNKFECFSRKKLTFLILGDICTRGCGFCSVKKGQPSAPDADEPQRIARAAMALNLRHVVITSVTRDDLADCGAGHFCRVVSRIKRDIPAATVEALTPDFTGKERLIEAVADSPVDIFSHNIETVERLYGEARPRADYARSLGVLKTAKSRKKITKSGFMVGLGETREEVYKTMRDLKDVACDFLTIGQYLRPTKKQLEVREFVHPDIFEAYKKSALSMGFKKVLSEPFARTSFMAH